MNAYDAPAGTVFERDDFWGDTITFVVLDGHIRNLPTFEEFRRIFVLESGELSCIGQHSQWSLRSTRIA